MTTPCPELILHGGNLCTLDDRAPRAQALACLGGRILCIGTDEQVTATRGPGTRAVDLGGRTVLPGFVDCHIHFGDWALGRRQLDLRGARSPEEAAALVTSRAGLVPDGGWIVGGGFDPNLWPAGAWPGRGLLDRAAPRHKVLLHSKDMHSCWVSSLALAAAGLDASSLDPDGGRIEREAGSEVPSGILRERATEAVQRLVPPFTVEEAAAAIGEALPSAWAEGLTGVHEILDTAEGLWMRAWQRRRREGGTGLRVYQHLPLEHLESAVQLGLETGLGDEWLRVAGVKLFADGALGSRTAHMLEPYTGAAGRGVPVLSPAQLRDLLGRAHRARLAVSIHAIGDGANREVLDAFEAALAVDAGAPRPRHRVEHVQLLDERDLPRFAALGLVASMQPIHAVSDMEMAERHWGSERCRLAYAWRSLLESGAHLCFGSDAPVEGFSVLEGLRAAVTRRRRDGAPGPAGWVPEQRLAIEQAVRAYTTEAAFASGEEALKGTLTEGKLADAVVLSHDILQHPESLEEARVEMTLLGGTIVYSAGDDSSRRVKG